MPHEDADANAQVYTPDPELKLKAVAAVKTIGFFLSLSAYSLCLFMCATL